MSAPPTSANHVHAAFMKWEWTPQSGRGEVLTAAAPAPAWLADEREAVRAALRMVQHQVLPAEGWAIVEGKTKDEL